MESGEWMLCFINVNEWMNKLPCMDFLTRRGLKFYTNIIDINNDNIVSPVLEFPQLKHKTPSIKEAQKEKQQRCQNKNSKWHRMRHCGCWKYLNVESGRFIWIYSMHTFAKMLLYLVNMHEKKTNILIFVCMCLCLSECLCLYLCISVVYLEMPLNVST